MSEDLTHVKEGDELLLDTNDETIVTVERVTSAQLVVRAKDHHRERRIRRSDGMLLGDRSGVRLFARLATEADRNRIAKRGVLEALHQRQHAFERELRKHVTWGRVRFPDAEGLLELSRAMAKLEFDLRVFREVWADELAAAKEKSRDPETD